MWVEQNGGQQELLAWTSLAAGVVTMSERFGGGIDVTAQSFAAMRDYLRPLLAEFVARVHKLKRKRAAALASARHLGNGDDHCRRAAWASPL